MTDDEITDLLFGATGPCARKALKAILAIHVPHKIYDECEHEHAYDDPALIDTGEFNTCAAGYMYSICRACCTAGWDHEQSEDCASDHDHGLHKPICPTVGAIDEALGIGVTADAH